MGLESLRSFLMTKNLTFLKREKQMKHSIIATALLVGFSFSANADTVTSPDKAEVARLVKETLKIDDDSMRLDGIHHRSSQKCSVDMALDGTPLKVKVYENHPVDGEMVEVEFVAYAHEGSVAEIDQDADELKIKTVEHIEDTNVRIHRFLIIEQKSPEIVRVTVRERSLFAKIFLTRQKTISCDIQM